MPPSTFNETHPPPCLTEVVERQASCLADDNFLETGQLLSGWFPATTGKIMYVDGGHHALGA